MRETVTAKAADYAASDNVFENFEIASDIAGITVDQQFLSLIGTKVARLRNLINGGQAANFESIEDSFIDLANYAALAAAYRRQSLPTAWGVLVDGSYGGTE